MITYSRWTKIFVLNVNYHRSIGWRGALNLLALCGALLCYLGCNPASSKPRLANIESSYRRGLAENPIREKFGMTPIQPSWICWNNFAGKDCWAIDPNATSTFKTVYHGSDGSMLGETDSYSSGRIFETIDGKIQEEFKLSCDYGTSQLWVMYLGDDKQIMSWVENENTNNAARLAMTERVKAKWGLGMGGKK